ncbi:MAG TPA: FliM/FliN family flagellar motor switch protein, partial [Hyphomonadaceae bacterium]
MIPWRQRPQDSPSNLRKWPSRRSINPQETQSADSPAGPCLYRSCVVHAQLGAVEVEITVLLGRSLMPMQQLLRMGRGAVIQLDT